MSGKTSETKTEGKSTAGALTDAPAVTVFAPPQKPTSKDALVFAADTPLESIPVPADRRARAAAFPGDDKRSGTDRRLGPDRRVVDIGSPTGLERRRGPGRRLSADRKSAEEGHMNDEQVEFVLAVDTYKRLNNRPFPSWTEVLEVVKQLGYRKVSSSTVNLPAPAAGLEVSPAFDEKLNDGELFLG